MPRRQELPEALAQLSRRNAIELSETRFHSDVNRLIEAIEKSFAVAEKTAKLSAPSAAVLPELASVRLSEAKDLPEPSGSAKPAEPKEPKEIHVDAGSEAAPVSSVATASDSATPLKSTQTTPAPPQVSSTSLMKRRILVTAIAAVCSGAFLLIFLNVRVPRGSHSAASNSQTPVGSLEKSPPSRTAAEQLEYANTLFDQKLYDRAATEYQRFLDDYPGQPSRANAYFSMGECYQNLNKPASARRNYERVVKDYGDSEFAGRATSALATLPTETHSIFAVDEKNRVSSDANGGGVEFVTIRPLKRTYIKVIVDGSDKPALERWISPADSPVEFRAKHVSIRVLDPEAVEITKNGMPVKENDEAVTVN